MQLRPSNPRSIAPGHVCIEFEISMKIADIFNPIPPCCILIFSKTRLPPSKDIALRRSFHSLGHSSITELRPSNPRLRRPQRLTRQIFCKTTSSTGLWFALEVPPSLTDIQSILIYFCKNIGIEIKLKMRVLRSHWNLRLVIILAENKWKRDATKRRILHISLIPSVLSLLQTN